MPLSRRQWLTSVAAHTASLSFPTWAIPAGARLFAAWQMDNRVRYQIGILQQKANRLEIQSAIDVPTRAHGLLREKNGSLLAVARRPGDWLLRWNPIQRAKNAVTWMWIGPDRAFNGHLIMSIDGRTIYTSETDLENGAGFIGVRDTHTLEKYAEWPTHGMDAHELLLDHEDQLIVANGGVPILRETGQTKRNLQAMDSSLVRIDACSGKLLGQWRMDDARLSLRHLAWVDRSVTRLGIAMQAEHDDTATRAAAPVFALFDGQTLRIAAQPRALAGYGGSIIVNSNTANDLVAVTCPRANGVALWNTSGKWQGFQSLDEVCPATVSAEQMWFGGLTTALHGPSLTQTRSTLPAAIHLDNHWLSLP